MTDDRIWPFGFGKSLAVFGAASLLLLLVTRYTIPFLTSISGLEPVVFWFIAGGAGVFLPLFITALFIVHSEGRPCGLETWKGRLRFRKPDKGDIVWSIGGTIVTGLSCYLLKSLLGLLPYDMHHHPEFMHFNPLTPERYWYLLLWFPYWILNIMGEEVLWRGVILPGQETVFGNKAWIVNGFCWGIFHIAFGWQLLITLIPILFILPYIVQKRKNSWTGVIIHAAINGPAFLAIAFGLK